MIPSDTKNLDTEAYEKAVKLNNIGVCMEHLNEHIESYDTDESRYYVERVKYYLELIENGVV